PAGLQLLHDGGQLGAGLLVAKGLVVANGLVVHPVTLAAISPSARRMRSGSPSDTSAGERTTVAAGSSRWTTAYPRSKVAAGDSARTRAVVWASSAVAASTRCHTLR